MGPADSRARAAGARRRARAGRPARRELRRPYRPGGGARGAGPPPGAVDRAGPVRELGHRGNDERGPTGAGRHGTGSDHQVRRLLPRTCGRFPGAGRLGRDHPRSADQPRRAQGNGGGHPHRALQRPRVRHEAAPRPPRACRGGHRRADRRQHGGRPARRGLPAGAAGGVRRARGAVDLRRGHLRLPDGEGGSAGRLRGAARSDLPRQDHRRWASRRGVRRAGRPDGPDGAGRSRLPGGDAVRQPVGDDGGHLGAVEPVGAALPPARGARRPPRGRPERGGRRGRRAVHRQRRRLGPHAVLPCGSGDRLRVGDGRGHGRVRRVLPRPPRPRHLSAPIAVRGVVPVGRAHRARRRPHGPGRRAALRELS